LKLWAFCANEFVAKSQIEGAFLREERGSAFRLLKASKEEQGNLQKTGLFE
jgi:hypothetical protein